MDSKLLFSSNCYESPPCWLSNERSMYNPFIDALYLPHFTDKKDEIIGHLFEQTHVMLTATRSKCLMRYLMSSVYDAILLMAKNQGPGQPRDWLEFMDTYIHIIDFLHNSTLYVEEAISLWTTMYWLRKLIRRGEITAISLDEVERKEQESIEYYKYHKKWWGFEELYDRIRQASLRLEEHIVLFGLHALNVPVYRTSQATNGLFEGSKDFPDFLEGTVRTWEIHSPLNRLQKAFCALDKIYELSLHKWSRTGFINLMRKYMPDFEPFCTDCFMKDKIENYESTIERNLAVLSLIKCQFWKRDRWTATHVISEPRWIMPQYPKYPVELKEPYRKGVVTLIHLEWVRQQIETGEGLSCWWRESCPEKHHPDKVICGSRSDIKNIWKAVKPFVDEKKWKEPSCPKKKGHCQISSPKTRKNPIILLSFFYPFSNLDR